MYHEAEEERFRTHVQYLKKHYRIISIEELVNRLHENDAPTDAVALTVDDGYRSVYENILPVAEAESVPVSVFVTTDYIDSTDLFWWDKADLVRERDPSFPSNPELKTYSERDRREQIDSRFGDLDLDHGRVTLTSNELRELVKSEYVTVHPHSKSHPRLTDQEDEAARREIVESGEWLRSEIGCSANVFSFPDGAYDERHLSMVRSGGYDGALTIEPGLNTNGTDPYRIKRLSLCGVREATATTHTFNASSLPTMAVSVYGLFRRMARKEFEM
jgi:peptidoglycan/xylan/chitin deacetylase (PgdA/CDA1 family)